MRSAGCPQWQRDIAGRRCGGDADTLACIAGVVAGVYYEVPDELKVKALARLDDLRSVVLRFVERFGFER